ncbi:DNA translocase FtsK 4TM domain-containing protein [Bacteroidota bacterium]
MTTKRKRTKKRIKKNNPFGKIITVFKDRRFRIILSLTCLFIAIFLTIALISYIFTWKADQSGFDHKWTDFITDPTIIVDNWAGKTGAAISNLLIYKWFGIASFSSIFIFFLFATRLVNINLLRFGRTLRISLIVTVLLSVTLSYIFGDSFYFLGGAYGHFISNGLNSLVGKAGTAFILLLILFSFYIFSTKKSEKLLQKVFAKKDNNDFSGLEEDNFSEDEIFEVKDKEIIDELNKKDLSKTINEESNIEVVFETDNITRNEPVEKEQEEKDESPEMTVSKKEEDDLLTENKYDEMTDYDPTLDLSSYLSPNLKLLKDHSRNNSEVSNEELLNNKNRIVETLANYKIKIDKIKATIGPTITLYEIIPAPGVRISRIKNLEDDIALSLSALGIRIIAPIPGKGTIGIEVPNQNPEIVSMHSIIASRAFQESKYELPIALGKTISNETYTFDLVKMPHILVAGATGQGKSVGLNAIITSLLYKKHPSQLKFVLIDPKKVELTLYSKIERHFLAKLPDLEDPIITDTKEVIASLNSLSLEMDNRYNLLKKAQVRNLKEYNTKFISRKLNPEKGHSFMPYLVVVIDEFADLIMTAGKEVELPLTRIAQLARAVGIHMVIATQRPSTNIITGTIKANFPARIAFKVASMIDSRTILDCPGANHLVGRGDMLISIGSDLDRLQCAFIDTSEIEVITEYIGSQRGFPTAWLLPDIEDESVLQSGENILDKKDELFEDAARLVVGNQQGSTSGIQRKFSIGYNRAGRIMDQLEAAGIVGSFEGSKPRNVLYQDLYSLEQFLNQINDH